MNEVVISEGLFNINDYIWYIVGGVCLFFVIVGFIADKSGLAKKTFNKDNTVKSNKNNVNNDVLPVENVVVENSPVVDNSEFVAESNDDNNTNVIVNEDNIADNSLLNTNEPIYLNDEQVEEALPVYNVDSSSSEDEESLKQDEEYDIQLSQDESVSEQASDVSIVSDNAEEEWGINVVQKDEDDSNLDEMELPDLNDVKLDEDVWKF